MHLLANKQQVSYENSKISCICKGKFEDKYAKDKKYQKVIDHYHYTSECKGAAHSICNLKYGIPTEINMTFHNRSNHDYHFIITELAEEFEGHFTCIGKKYITFSVPIEKEI